MSKAIIGFDIGAHEIKLVRWNGSQLTHAASVPTPEGLVSASQITDFEAMAKLLKVTARKYHIRGKDCAVILPSRFCYLRRVTIPAMTISQLKVNLPYEFKDFLTEGIDKYFFDYSVNELLRGQDGQPEQMDLTACAVSKALVEQYRTMFRKAGFKLKTAIPVECAYANLIMNALGKPVPDQPEDRREYCLVDLGHTGTRIHIFTGRFFENTRESDAGLSGLAGIVANATGLDLEAARDQLYNDLNGARSLPGALELYTAISNDVRKTVNFYGFNHRESDITELWCCGNGYHNTALLDNLQQVLALEVRPIDALMPPSDQEIQGLSAFAAAAGAALQ